MASRKLLVVDDEVDLVVVLVRMARDHGYDASGTIDPTDVMQIVRTSQPDVVLLDLHMPRVDGRDLIARIVAEPTSPAVIVMSGWVDELTRDLCRTYGAIDIVRKPFTIDDLFRRIDAAARTTRI